MKGLVATILTLAVVLVGSAQQAGALQVLYTFESPGSALDKRPGDGLQNPQFHQAAGIDPAAANAAFGVQSGLFPALPASPTRANTIEILGSNSLGSEFTLAAMVDPTNLGPNGNKFMRVFSAYDGGSISNTEMLIDFGYYSSVEYLRFAINGLTLMADPPANFTDGNYHHVAGTYDNGDLALYIDGNLLNSSSNSAGAVSLSYNLHFGEDVPTSDLDGDQFYGNADDILVWDSALSESVIRGLYLSGAGRALPEPSSFVMLALGAMTLVGRGWRKRRRE